MAKIDLMESLRNTTLQGAIDYTSGIQSDYAKSTMNPGIKAFVKLPYYDDTGNPVSRENRYEITGFLTSGFGWSISNDYEDLLPQTQAQKKWSNIAQGISVTGDQVLSQFFGADSSATDMIKQYGGANKLLMSIQQTIAIWQGMKKPSFSIKMLFFDAMGEDNTDVRKVAYRLERAQYPYISDLGAFGANLYMQAPGGYLPRMNNSNDAGQVNKTYALHAENTAELFIGNYIHFPELICSGVDLEFSDKILTNGHPQWLTASLSFIMWKMPTLRDLEMRYV